MSDLQIGLIALGVLLILLVLGFNFLGDGLRDALDPLAQGRRSGTRDKA